MKYSLFLVTIALFLFNQSVYAEAVTIEKVNYVYVLDVERSFDFSGGTNHECGSNLYRTTTVTEDIVNRKFSVVLAAFAAGKKIILNTEGCSGNRMRFGWVRVAN